MGSASGDAEWPAGDGERVFVYLSGSYGRFVSVIRRLGAARLSTLVHARDISLEQRRRLETATLRFSAGPVDLRQAALQCSVVVCHGGHGTTAAMLLAGKPLLLLPQHVEQALVGTRVAKLGAGLVAGRARKQLDYAAIVKRLVDEPSFSEKARAFASKYEDFDRAGLFEAIAARCEALLSTGSG